MAVALWREHVCAEPSLGQPSLLFPAGLWLPWLYGRSLGNTFPAALRAKPVGLVQGCPLPLAPVGLGKILKGCQNYFVTKVAEIL